MMYAMYSHTFNGWVVYERRQIDNHVVDVPISVPYKTVEEAIKVLHTVYDMREKLNLL